MIFIETLTTQLINDYQELFSNTENYADMLVKEQYERYPSIRYPMITVGEIANENVNKYWDGDKENVSYLAYQIGIYSEETEDLTAIENVKKLANIIDNYMQGERYKCLRRIGNLSLMPLATDDNVIVGYLRYECNLDINTNTIYRRY